MSNLVTLPNYTCPVCGYSELKVKPYAHMPPVSKELEKFNPPYENIWGKASYDVCSCCGFEFGNDDNGMDPSRNMSFLAYRNEWITEENARWFEPELKPANWDLATQLQRAGLV
jgi:rubredoxin